MASVNLSTFYVTVEETTPVFKARMDSRTEITIAQFITPEDILEATAHRDPSYQASFNRCTSLGCTDYTKGFNYAPSCGECEKPLFEPFKSRKLTCLADVLLQRINYDIDNLISEDRNSDWGGGMPIVDNDIKSGRTDYFYSDAYVEYKRYIKDIDLNGVTDYGWRAFPGLNGEVSYNKFFAMSGFWLGLEPCHGANRLFQCAVSCENGEVVGCWQVGDLARETGANPLSLYGEVEFGSVWTFTGFEAGTPKAKYYQIYDPAQIIAAGLKLTREQILPLNPTLSINNFLPSQQTESTGFANCKTTRTSIDFGDSDFLRESNCLSGGNKRYSSTEKRCSTCDLNSYKPTRAIDKFIKLADSTLNIERSDEWYTTNIFNKELNEIPASEFAKLRFTVVGDIRGKVLTDGNDCYFPKAYSDGQPGKFVLGGATTATKTEGYKQATYTDLGLSANFQYDDCIQCLEAKANAEYLLVNSAINEVSLISPFYDKCGVDVGSNTTHLKYNIDCNCVRCGDIYITGAPRYVSATNKWEYEPWVTTASVNEIYQLPQKIKVNSQFGLIDDPECVPSKDDSNAYYPYAKRKDPGCWDPNSGQYRRIWYFWDKSKTFTDFQFRNIPENITSPTGVKDVLFNRNTLWSGCGGLANNDRAVVPFGITCYEKLREQQIGTGRAVPSTLSIVSGVKLAPENEFTQAEIDADIFPLDSLNATQPRTYLYYSRRATTSYLPCDSTNTAPSVGTYQCSCAWLPCMDEIMLTAVPIKYKTSSTDQPLKLCSSKLAATEAFPSIFELHLEKSNKNSTTEDLDQIDGLYPLVGPNMYENGVPKNSTFSVGLNWDSNYNNNNINFTSIGGAGAYKYQTSYFNNYYVDYLEPTYFWNRPISFLNTPGIMKSHNTPVNNTYFRLQRLHDIYHINCSSTTVGGVVKWGEYGYVQGGTPPTMGLAYNSTYYSNNNFFVSLGGSTLPEIYGPTVPSEVPLNIIDPANTNYGR